MRAQELADAYGYLKHGELPFLIELIRSLPDDPLVANIGAGSGTSGLAILEARDDSFLVTIDLYDRIRPTGALGNERYQVARSSLMHRRAEICSGSALAGKNWWTHKEKKWWRRKVDMVFHDAAHNYDTLKAEIEAWLPRVRAKGIIAIHDYTSEHWGGVALAVDELLRPK
ncbi:unnamed protein product, partial [marine sediment metagenome]